MFELQIFTRKKIVQGEITKVTKSHEKRLHKHSNVKMLQFQHNQGNNVPYLGYQHF